MDPDTPNAPPDAPSEPVGRVNLKPDEPVESDGPVESDEPATRGEVQILAPVQRWNPISIPLGLLAIALIVGALVFILQGAYEPAGY